MADTKLSNTYGLAEAVDEIPSQIKTYTESVREDVDDTKRRSLYYSEMSIAGIVTCIILCVIGAWFIVNPVNLFKYSSIGKDAKAIYDVLGRVSGCAMLLAGIHGIGRMIFGGVISSCEKRISKLNEWFVQQFESASLKYTPERVAHYIENCMDEKLPESDDLDSSLENTVDALYSKNKLMNRLTLISRIALPAICYLAALIVTFNVAKLKSAGVVTAFVFMIIFSRRICLLLEYKTGSRVRAVMAVPAVVYGILMYIMARGRYDGMHFVSDDMYMNMSGVLKPFVSSIFAVCLIQVVVLVLAVFSQDYYSEKKRLFEGVGKNRKQGSMHKRWYIYCSAAWHIFLFTIYAMLLAATMMDIQNLKSVGSAVALGVVFGLFWRLISPIWPENISKAIRKFWGVKYSLVVSAFVFAAAATSFLLLGFVFTGYAVIALISLIAASWIAFAVMVHFWG